MNLKLLNITIQVNDNIYLKDPESSDLGRSIIEGSIDIISEHGFEYFTFRKLGEQINSTEASIYRYFKSKNKLLLYLTSWYWSWMEYRFLLATTNVESPQERLSRAIKLLTEPIEEDSDFSHINEVKLHQILICESPKSYLIKEVDEENKQGVYADYKRLVGRISDIILEINPTYKYPHMLISTVIEGAHSQRYFADHLPRLTDVISGEDAVPNFYGELVIKAIKE